jgi:hypothetical protein
MTYEVRWIQSALDGLAELWMAADSAGRADINRAVTVLDQQLQSDPYAVSESRDPRRMGLFFRSWGRPHRNRSHETDRLGIRRLAD